MVKQNHLLIFILTIGVFGILNTEMGIIGLLPSLADRFDVSVTHAGLLVSVFALGIAISGPIMPLLFSGMNRKKVMLLVLGVFVIANIVSLITTSFTMLLIARIIPALFHPIYCSLAFTVAGSSVSKEEAPRAVSKVFIGISAGMVAGVPIASFMNHTFSYEWAMAFFLIVNALVFIATVLFVPSMPVKERLTYGSQFSVIKRPVLWISIVTVILLNASVFGVYSYLTEYLGTVTKMSPNATSLTLFIFGGANMIGNIIAGRLLTHSAAKAVFVFPLLLVAVYILIFFTGQLAVAMAITTILWGILAGGIMANINQYLIMSAAPQAPDFANGLFISACNIGTTVGTAVGGIFITQMGTPYLILVGILSLVLSLATILFRNYLFAPVQQLSK
ncbi:MFS transporter [Paenibacillus urinalis]|uniref:MFS transporter n=1 Tax=Paenibacillus urinalis TaxID=521520 RepID=A0ABY7X5W3_9BACL|nr:MFS transporter [Paenibacillus urinalis]WDH96621.1 MFS transporter [Paenibacillus urinalis]WDI00265.1 MFS transporter [Paenibacillus urinalis]